MNRRNFVVGLGTVATISGVASVTAASFADSVEAGGNFQVIVDEELTVEAGEQVPDDNSGDGWTGIDLTDDDEHEDLTADNFDDDDDGTLAHFADSEATNEDLDIGLAVLNNEDEVPENRTYEEFLNIQNDGATDQEVGIQYVFGDDVDTTELDDDVQDNTDDGDIAVDTVTDLFTFETTEDDEQLSPSGSDNEPGEVTVDPGENQVDLIIDLDGNSEEIAEAADVEDGIFDDDGVNEAVDLLNSIVVGLIEEDDE